MDIKKLRKVSLITLSMALFGNSEPNLFTQDYLNKDNKK